MFRLLALSSALLAACGDGPANTSPDAGSPDAGADAITQPGCVTSRQWGGSGDDTAAVTVRGGAIYVHGSTGGAANHLIDPGLAARGYLDRYDGDTKVWSYTPTSLAAIDLVSPNDDGSLEIVGRAVQGSQLDLAIGTLSASGGERSLELAGVAPSERPFQLLADGDQRAIVGYHDIYVPANYVESWQDPFVYRWDATRGVSSGSIVRAASGEPDVATGATFAADGTLLVAGGSLAGHGSWIRPVTAGFDAPVWGIANGLDNARTIRRLPDGDFLIAGTTSHRLGQAVLGGEDAFVARIAPDLATPRWVTQVGSSGDEIVIDAAIDDGGRIWILGETNGDVAAPNAGSNDLFVIALDANGTERWRVQRGSTGDERMSSIAIDACEQVLVAGATDGPLLAPARGYDAFLLAIAPNG